MTTALSVSRLPRPAIVLGFAAAYAVAFALSERAYGTLAVPSPFWLPDSILLCALLLTPRAQWWVFVTAIWPIRFLVGGVPGTPLWFVLVSIANDMIKALAGVWLLQRLIGRRVRLEKLRELLVFFAVAGAALPLASAAAAAPARYALGNPVWSATYRWFLGDALTQVVVTPMLMYWCGQGYRRIAGRLGEMCMLCAALLLALSYAFAMPPAPGHSLAFLYIPVPFLVWAAVRLGPFGTANAISLVAVVSMVAAVRGSVFTGGASVLSLQLFLLVLAVSLLLLALVLVERTEFLDRERTFSAQLFQAQDRERTRIAGELHDNLGQQLALLKHDIELLGPAVPDHAFSIVAGAAQRADDVAASIRTISHQLHPTRLRVIGLVSALKGLVEESSGHGPRLTFDHQNVPDVLPQDLTVMLFRIAQEALQNAVKHSRAERVVVQVVGGVDTVTVSIQDDGVGFALETVRGRGLGLMSMDERAEAAGGRLTIQSKARHGTRVDVTVPLPDGDVTSTVVM